ncbi:MAG: RNA polymerase sigma factor [Streptosporangiaceae bacterium]
MDICDGDLVRRARAGDAAAFRLLVERHSPSARARAARLCGRADDVDDIVQEAFLQAFMALDRLRDPDRFGAWLGGIIRNVHRAAGRVPADAEHMGFEITLAGPGRVQLRNVELG